jgi:hypothetical protein
MYARTSVDIGQCAVIQVKSTAATYLIQMKTPKFQLAHLGSMHRVNADSHTVSRDCCRTFVLFAV